MCVYVVCVLGGGEKEGEERKSQEVVGISGIGIIFRSNVGEPSQLAGLRQLHQRIRNHDVHVALVRSTEHIENDEFCLAP